MLRISKLTDYGVVLLTAMAGRPEATVTACDAARDTGIPQPTVSKVLKQLARLGIVESHRGVHGGYRLSRPPEHITIAEVIRALEGPIAVTECSSEDTAGACEYEGRCDVRGNWQRINAAVESALEGISLLEMARSGPSALVPLGRGPSRARQQQSA